MALTLTEAAKLSNDVLRSGVIDTVASTSYLLQLLPFIPIVGNGLTYNRLNVAPTAAFYDVGDDWVEGTPTFTQKTAVLKILGGDADVDNFLARTRSNVQDLRAEVTHQKALAVGRKFVETVIVGDTTSDANSFDGIAKTAAAGQTVTLGTGNGAAITFEAIDEAIDMIRGGEPSALLMSRRTRRNILSLARDTTQHLETQPDAFGRWVTHYNGIPMVIDDNIPDDETIGTSDDCSSLYVVRLGGDGLCGLASPGDPADESSIVQVEDVGALESKDANRYRVKMYASVALFNSLALAKIKGIIPPA